MSDFHTHEIQRHMRARACWLTDKSMKDDFMHKKGLQCRSANVAENSGGLCFSIKNGKMKRSYKARLKNGHIGKL